MNTQDLTQRHLDFAVNDAKVWFRNIPKLNPRFIQSKIIECIFRQFLKESLPLTQFELIQLDAKTYTVTVNKTAFANIKIEKEVSND